MYFIHGPPVFSILGAVGYDEGTLGGFAWGGQRCSPRPLGQMTADPKWNNSKGINGTGNSTNWPSWNGNPIDTANGGVNPTCSLKHYRGGLRCCHGNDLIADSNLVVSELPSSVARGPSSNPSQISSTCSSLPLVFGCSDVAC